MENALRGREVLNELKAAVLAHQQLLQSIVGVLEAEVAAQEKQRIAWQQSLKLSPPNLKGRVKLDVGGKPFLSSAL